MTITTAPTDPAATLIHGPHGEYTVVFRGHRQPEAISALSALGPRRYGSDHLVAKFTIIEDYTVANNDTFRRIMDCLGWEITEVTGFLHPDGSTVWLGQPVV